MTAEIIPQKFEDVHGLLRYRTSTGNHEGIKGKDQRERVRRGNFRAKMFSRSIEGTAKHSV